MIAGEVVTPGVAPAVSGVLALWAGVLTALAAGWWYFGREEA